MLLFILELIGTIAFAISGAIVGIRKRMDLFGVCVLGVVTAVGGGMLRDMIILKIPGALTDPVYTITAALSCICVFFFVYLNKSHTALLNHAVYSILLFFMDSIGLGIFTAVGARTGIEAGYPNNTFLLVFLGTITGVGGGLLRDVMAEEPPYILTKHIYACASIAGAFGYVALYRHFGESIALVVSPVIVILIRISAAHYHWNLPRIAEYKD